MTKPYKKVTISFLAKELTIDATEVESMLVDMILEGRLVAQIDQINGFAVIGLKTNSLESRKLKALSGWADALSQYSENFCHKLM